MVLEPFTRAYFDWKARSLITGSHSAPSGPRTMASAEVPPSGG
ncbi:hypothetical protein [Streptomyces sp. NPDC004976]